MLLDKRRKVFLHLLFKYIYLLPGFLPFQYKNKDWWHWSKKLTRSMALSWICPILLSPKAVLIQRVEIAPTMLFVVYPRLRGTTSLIQLETIIGEHVEISGHQMQIPCSLSQIWLTTRRRCLITFFGGTFYSEKLNIANSTDSYYFLETSADYTEFGECCIFKATSLPDSGTYCFTNSAHECAQSPRQHSVHFYMTGTVRLEDNISLQSKSTPHSSPSWWLLSCSLRTSESPIHGRSSLH